MAEINLLIALVVGVVILAYLAFIAVLSFDAFRSGKMIWLLFILGLPLVGAIIYFFVEKEHDYLKLPRAEQEE